MALPLTLPTIQNWSCHNCSGCCKQHLIEITDAEHDRIKKQNWSLADGVPNDQPVVVSHGGMPWNRRHRLSHTADGSCVFLNEDGLCRIHAKFGEAAKPLACRIYPYAFHPAGKRITVSLRFSCPSVVANLGTPVDKNRDEIKSIARLVVPDGVDEMPPPNVNRSQRVDWRDFMKFVTTLHDMIELGKGTVIERLYRALVLVRLIDQAKYDLVNGARLTEFLDIIREASLDEEIPAAKEPAKITRLQFRQLVALYARKDTVADLRGGWLNRWKLLRAAVRFASGSGKIPQLQDCFGEATFDQLEAPFGNLPEGADEVLNRYLSVKIQGLHFCGAAYHNVPLVEGFQSLALIVPSICWIARWLAVTNNRATLDLSDIHQAITIADHHQGYSPALGSLSARKRVRYMDELNEITNLALWYSR
jgi:lysine-N-methylase